MDLVQEYYQADRQTCLCPLRSGIIKEVLTIKRGWIIPVIIAVIVAGVFGYWGYGQYRAKRELEMFMGNKYQQSFYGMVDHIEQVQVLLGKALVSSSPRHSIMILTDVWSHANTAQAELNKLPLAAQTVYQTAKFLSQTGDYAHVLANQQAEGKVMTTENRQKLQDLRQHAIKVAESLQDVERRVFAGDINWVNLVKQAGENVREQQKEGEPDPLNGLEDVREEMGKVPVLIYDGPFSDHVVDRKPRGLTGEEIDKEQARTRARKMVDFKEEGELNISEGTSVNGRITSYNFQVKNGDNEVYSVDISKKGGHLVSLLNNREAASSKISLEEAVDKARDYLAINGYPNMESTYSEVKDNIAYISFAYQQDDTIFYTDIINVQVALDQGQILAVEALGYLMSHQSRELESPEIAEEEAKEMAQNTLDEIENVRLAVIPQPSLKEVLTYEVRGTAAGETYLIYYNAITGDEEQILKVILGQEGTFAL